MQKRRNAALVLVSAAAIAQPPAAYFQLPTPCRVLDTRLIPAAAPPSGAAAALGMPHEAQQTKLYTIAGLCGIPSEASGILANVTVVPREPQLAYITIWPGDRPLPNISTLNAMDGQITANFESVNLWNGRVAVFATNRTDLIFDVKGYYKPDRRFIASTWTARIEQAPLYVLTMPLGRIDSKSIICSRSEGTTVEMLEASRFEVNENAIAISNPKAGRYQLWYNVEACISKVNIGLPAEQDMKQRGWYYCDYESKEIPK